MIPRLLGLAIAAALVVTACADGDSSTDLASESTGIDVTTSATATSGSSVEVANAAGEEVVAVVGASPTIDDVVRSLSPFPFEQLSTWSGMDVDELRDGLETIYSELAPQARAEGFARPRSAPSAPQFVNPLAFMGAYGADQGINKIRNQKDPATDEFETGPKSVTKKLTTATGSIEMTIAIGGTIMRVEGSSWTISTSATVTSSIVGDKPLTVVEDVQLSVTATSCPDAAGQAPFEFALAVDSRVTSGEGSGATSTLTSSTTGFALANDNADLASEQQTLSVQRTFTDPGKPPISVEFGLTMDLGKNVSPNTRDGRLTWDGIDAKSAGALAVNGSILSAVTVSSVAGAMEQAWKSGLCVEVRLDLEAPGGRRYVKKNEEVPIAVSASNRLDGADLAVPVEARLEGPFLIAPSGSRPTAPATFTYTAGSTNGDEGTVTVQAISKRGKSKPVSIIFELRPGYTVDTTGYSGAYRITGQVCDTSSLFSLNWDGGQTTLTTGTMEFLFSPSFDVSDWTFAGSLGGLAVNATGTWTIDEDAETITLVSQNWTVEAPFAGTLPLGPGGQHIDLSAPIQLLSEPPPTC